MINNVIRKVNTMNKQHREEAEMKGRGRHREKKEGKKHMSHGGSAHGDVGFNGERSKATHSYEHAGFKNVERVLRGEVPQTNMGTIHACGGGAMGKHMAAGGAAKVRKGEY